MDEEEYCRHVIDMLQRDYQRAARPFYDRLARIRSMRPPQPLVVPADSELLTAIQRIASIPPDTDRA